MQRCLSAIITAVLLCSAFAGAQVTRFVDVFVGTQGDHGQLHPGATVPFGLVVLGPDTDGGLHTGYDYANDNIKGFSHTRVPGVGCSGAGETLRVTPSLGKNLRDTMDKKTEAGCPGYYTVTLASGIKARLTASTRAGFHSYSFPISDQDINIHFDPSKSLSGIKEYNWRVVDNTLITGLVKAGNVCGHGYTVLYYAVRLETPLLSWEAAEKGLWCNFGRADKPRIIQLKVGLSPISVEQAIIEADNDMPGWDFEAACRKADAAWETVLGKVDLGVVPAEMEEFRNLFYTCLYRSYQYPNNVTASNGQYRMAGDENTIRQTADTAPDYVNYSGWSSWDDFRKFSLITLLEPQIGHNIARSIVEWFAGDSFPQWGSGYWPSATVRHEFIGAIVVDAFFKGLNDYDPEIAYKGVKNTIMGNDQLEKPYQYYLVMKMARALAKDSEAAEYEQKAQGYKQYWCAEQVDGEGNVRGFFTSDGHSVPREKVNETNAVFYQGNLWHYRYWVPHDIDGLARLRGSKTLLADDLEYYFANYQHIPHNQPPLTWPYLFNYLDRPWRTQYWSRHFLTEPVTVIHESRGKFRTPLFERVIKKSPDGYMLTMDDDAGSMASNFVFSAMGLYPACMGEPSFVIGSPLFPQMTLTLTDGKQFNIIARNSTLANKYIQSATLNGEPYDQCWINYSDIIKGGTLQFEMGPVPNFDWSLRRPLRRGGES